MIQALCLSLALAVSGAAAPAEAAPVSAAAAQARLSDDQIRDRIIASSIAAYSGSCPCPYSTDRAGRRCGGRSAYSRPGGASPKCYRSDISDAQVARWRTRFGG